MLVLFQENAIVTIVSKVKKTGASHHTATNDTDVENATIHYLKIYNIIKTKEAKKNWTNDVVVHFSDCSLNWMSDLFVVFLVTGYFLSFYNTGIRAELFKASLA